MEAQEALRDVQLPRERTADRLVTPGRWYPPPPPRWLAVAAVCLAVGLGTSATGVAVMLVVCLLAAATMGAMVRTYRDRTNVWLGPAQARGSARHWWIGYVVVLVACMAVAVLRGAFDWSYGVNVVAAAVAFVATVVMGRRGSA
ncbi:hypothetical protein D1832_03925 [Dermacoccus abyssi]|uniref:Uncharacterized protein n=2 Tax=Dermacoccus abyssi TaxID=322596 RepID=A0A417Z934_9MICO|nr:hypothetical protein [Dermacoccus abyssi]RHW47140.1 hypothetical protein D1832_03925 [Dermacoccus abyssi]